MTTTELDTDPVIAALQQLAGGNDALVQTALLYARAYEANPAAVIGMLCVTQSLILANTTNTDTAIREVKEQVQPILENPAILLQSIPEPFRSMLGM